MVTLVIVESPAKAKKIQTFLGKSYIVKSSCGHIRDLHKQKLSIQPENKFKASYYILKDKQKVVKQLKSVKADNIILATDDDREGDAIAWHCGKLLGVNFKENNRIKFTEITKNAILNALKNPMKLDMDSVNAQQTRRILDRLIGFKLSPLLWKHIESDKKGLSAGRVQSCLLKMILTRENDIIKFKPKYTYDVKGTFESQGISLECDFHFKDKESITESKIYTLFKICSQDRTFNVVSSLCKQEKKYPPTPFITSSLQQASQSELHMSVAHTMSIAQKLYEEGKITYMRTDSMVISEDFKDSLQKHIEKTYGNNYYHNHVPKQIKKAQEAHEAIRVTNVNETLTDIFSEKEKKLYNLIKKRTIQSHMKPAIYDVITIQLSNPNIDDYGYYQGKQKSLRFDGYLAYTKNTENRIDLNQYKSITKYTLKQLHCDYKQENPPPYYNESMLVKKLETSGIGRPSTYASLIQTLYSREYTELTTVPAKEIQQDRISLQEDNTIVKTKQTVQKKEQKKRIQITDLGKQVIQYLEAHFETILDPSFTSSIEDELDRISDGTTMPYPVIQKVYDSFIHIVEEQMKSKCKNQIRKTEPTWIINNEEAVLKHGKYGDYIQWNSKNFNVLNYLKVFKKDISSLTEKDIYKIIEYPKKMGTLKQKPVLLCLGPHGFYVNYHNKNYRISQKRNYTLDECIRCIT
jgi:DNA topoisomerase-1